MKKRLGAGARITEKLQNGCVLELELATEETQTEFSFHSNNKNDDEMIE